MPGTLGEGINTAAIYSRGGASELLPLKAVSGLEWGRNRNAFSTAQVTVTGDDGNYGQLGDVHAWAHELVLFRNTRRVWEGPIRYLDWGRGNTVIYAVDVLGWLARRRIKAYRQVVEGAESPVTTEMDLDLTRAFALDDPDVLTHRLVLHHTDEAKIARDVAPNSGMYDTDFTSMAGQGGNFTVIGRRAILFPDEVLLGRLDPLTDKHTTAEIRVAEDGDALATSETATNSDGLVATVVADSTDVDDTTGVSAFYGLHEQLRAADDMHTTAGLSAVAARAVAQLYPAPTVINMPGDSVLKPTAPFTVEQLVPGVLVPVESTATPRRTSGSFILDSMKVTQGPSGEQVTVTVTNASAFAGAPDGG